MTKMTMISKKVVATSPVCKAIFNPSNKVNLALDKLRAMHQQPVPPKMQDILKTF